MSDLHVRELGPHDAHAIDRLLSADPPAYRQHFDPFPSGLEDVAKALDDADADRFWGIIVDDEIAALLMLRGLDAGFSAPAFGVYVAQTHANHGLGSAALAFAQTWCKLNDHSEVMLTVHPDNAHARRLYEREGFVASGERSSLGHLIYRKRLSQS